MDRGYLANGALKQWDMRANYLKFYTQCEANPIACTTSLQHPRCSYFKLSIGDVRHRRGRSQRGRRLGFLDGLGPFSVFFVGVYSGLRRVPDHFCLCLFCQLCL